MNAVLSFQNLTKAFPGVNALQGVSFSINEGEVLALIGENGAGKSTLIKCLTGAYEPSSGLIELFGKSYNKIPPGIAKELGIGAVYQEFNLIPNLPIVENVFIGNNPGNGIIVDQREMLRKAGEIFRFFEVNIDPKAPVYTLSPAMMQIVEIAKATALEPKVLILDEPTAPLTIKETELLFKIIRSLKEQGVAVIYISHRLEEVFEICDRIVVLRDGAKVGERNVSETNRDELIRMMIGRRLENYYPEHKREQSGEVVLKVENVTGNGNKNISFNLHKGEVLGFAGLVGAGRTELMAMLFCQVPKISGTIEINGKPFKGKNPWNAIESGIALIPEDRKNSGLLLDKSVRINLTLACIKRLSGKMGLIDFKEENKCIEDYCRRLQIKTPSKEQEIQYLSGGNQQKVIIAKWLATDSDIMLFDEPTRGIDVGAKTEIYEIINQLAAEGRSIIMVSSEFEELIGVADKIAVMCEGELVGIVDKESFNLELLLDMASGSR